MALITAPRRPATSFYRGSDYTPETIGSWVATENRDMPWNTIGTALEHSKGEGTKVDHLMTAEEALRLSGLDIDVKKVPVMDAETGQAIPKLFATCYDPEDEPRYYFGAVSDKYHVVKPSANLRFFDGVIRDHHGAHYSAVWGMREKSQLGVTIEFPETIVVDPGGAADTMGLYGLGFNSFDGSTGLGFATTAVRFWCMNQLPPIIRLGKNVVRRGFSFKHTAGIEARTNEAQKVIGVSMNWAKAFDKVAGDLFASPFSDKQLERFMASLDQFKLDGGETDLVKARTIERRENVMEAWRAPHNANITGTRWGAFNVLGEYADWGRTVHGSKRTGTDATRQRAIGTMVNWPTAFKSNVLERLAA